MVMASISCHLSESAVWRFLSLLSIETPPFRNTSSAPALRPTATGPANDIQPNSNFRGSPSVRETSMKKHRNRCPAIASAIFIGLSVSISQAVAAQQAVPAIPGVAIPTPKVIGPLPSTISPARDYTWLTTAENLEKYGYIEEEFYIDGTASAYQIPTSLTDYQWLGGGYAYRTRVVVRHPVNQKKFSGNVLLEWINVTTGVDIDFNWMESCDYIMRSGHAYVGVSAQKLGIDALKAWSPARYGSLEVTGGGQYLKDELSFDIYSQVAQAIRNNPDTRLLGNLNHIRTIVATGPSQSGRFLSYYHNVIHPVHRVVDGFAIVAHTNPLRKDLDVKTMRLLTETDVRMEKEIYQIFDFEPDTKYFRRWEVAGTSHIGWSDVLKYEPLLIRDRGVGLPVNTVITPYSRIPIDHVVSAAYARLFDWINKDKAPPTAPRIKWVGNSRIARDGYGNALGGIRLPEHLVPTATNTGEANGTEFFATLVGTYVPFSDALLQKLYPIHGRYTFAVIQSATSLLKQGFLLKEDAMASIRESARVPIDGMNRPSGTLFINDGAEATSDPNLTLTLSATGPRPVTRMRFKEDHAAWLPWQAFSSSVHFVLTTSAGRDGKKTVYAEFMDAAGRASGAAMDTILLDRVPPTGRVELDDGAASTLTPTVTVDLVAKGGVAMQLMLDGDAGWRDWEPFVRNTTVTLAGGSGTKIVQARFADAAGNISAVASDTIVLEAGPIPLADALVMMRPYPVWQHFYDLTQVPRPSHHEEGASALVAAFGRGLGLETIVDGVGNVIIRKPATAGRAKSPGVVLQAHLDMVAQMTPDAPSDPRTDPIHAFVQDGWVQADRTTLGADDGIGVALIMGILEARDIAHGPIEALFTVDEEDRFDGINALSPTALKGRLYINVDNEVEGQFLISSAGGIYVKATDTYGEIPTPVGMTGFTLTVDGLLGGHSGVDIDKGRGSAHQIMARLLVEAPPALDVRVASVAGGDLSNAIPRTTVALVAIPTAQSAAFQTYVTEFAATVAGELATTDPNVTVTAQPVDVPAQVMQADAQQALIGAVFDVPQGVYRMSAEVPGLVETSGNLGVLSIADGEFFANSYVRSAIDSERDAEAQRFADVLAMAGATVTLEGAYSSWSPNLDSPLLKLMTQVYSDMFGVSPVAAAIHAGLETSVAGVTFPGMDMISVGPSIIGVHSPGERLDVASVQKVFDLIVSTLERIGHTVR